MVKSNYTMKLLTVNVYTKIFMVDVTWATSEILNRSKLRKCLGNV